MGAKSSDQSHDFSYHGASRGQFHANLVSGPVTPPDFSGLDTVDLLMSNVELVSARDPNNAYKCQVFDLGQLLGDGRDVANKQHVIKMGAKLNAQTGQYVH